MMKEIMIINFKIEYKILFVGCLAWHMHAQGNIHPNGRKYILRFE